MKNTMKNAIKFLTALKDNNNREWFAAHKDEYRQAVAEFDSFVVSLIEGIASFDPSVRGLAVKDCTYRIYRDTRFSNDKSPYKTHMGAYVCRGGKKSGYAGYYFHLEPAGEGLLGGNVITSGIYLPEPKVLRSIREDILDNGGKYLAAIEASHGFALEKSSSLKRNPAGFPEGSGYDDLLKLRDIYVTKSFDNTAAAQASLLEKTVDDFRSTLPLITLLNKAAQYAFEEM